ncbi:hypothetical protein N1031_07835 [Herbiconiux moechotypicola]|uniref:DUF2207 domain-containing protein n=1 Tax=Herbiconiux moechotypicola TaxID=637393 RepID=A0ABN3DJ68_9MICO|nr:hypothetical protein [Herbiconiux moechotypicola]MCS5729669.1 hypothetical protein [Herbiconiux moechotypicola]
MGIDDTDEQVAAAAPVETDRPAAVAQVLAEIIAMMREYELPHWESALTADRRRVLDGDDEVYGVIRYRLSVPRGFADVRVGFGDRALNARLDELRTRLAELVVDHQSVLDAARAPKPVEVEPREPDPPAFGVRVEYEPAPLRVRKLIASDYPRGTVVNDEDGRLVRSTISVLHHDEAGRLRPWHWIWLPVEPVSVEEYRSLRRTCIGWWVSLAAMPVIAVGTGAAGLRPDIWMIVVILAGIVMTGSAVMVGVMERRRSAVVALYSEKSGALVIPRSRGSRLHRVGGELDSPAHRAAQAEVDAAVDRRMLRRLKRSGTSGVLLEFLSCEGRLPAEALVIAALGEGWELRFAGPSSMSELWSVILERDVTNLDSHDVRAAREYFETLVALAPSGSYDGWQLDAAREGES